MAENTTELKTAEAEIDKVVLVGNITSDFTYHHSTKSANIYKSFISVKRDSGVEDLIPVMATERVLKEAFSLTEEKSYGAKGYKVCIEGLMASYNEHITENKSTLILYVKPNNILIVSDDNAFSNKIELTGYIVKDVIKRETPGIKNDKGAWVKSPRKVADVLLGVNLAFDNNKISYYIPCIAWSKCASAISALKIGTQINLRGRIQSRNYIKKLENGEALHKVAYEVSITDFVQFDENGNAVPIETKENKKKERPKKEKKVTVKTRHNPNGFNLV